jgi:RNA polymerase sigma-70 factor (ECF subfamily)
LAEAVAKGKHVEKALSQSRLQAIVEEAQAAWPGVVLSGRELASYLVERAEPGQALEDLHTTDLYLAFGCSKGDPTALAWLEKRFLSQVQQYVAGTNAQAPVIDEVAQLLRAELLVGRPGSPPGITKYRGRGALGGWLRLIALRTARDLLRGRGKQVSLDENTGSGGQGVELQVDDPELQYLKDRYGEQVSRAFRATLAELSAEDRILLGQYFLDGLSTDAIARLHRVNGSTIRRRLMRLRQSILDETHRQVTADLGLASGEAKSLIALVRSRIGLSVRAHLKR